MYSMKRKPQVIAHRGFSGAYPENTRSAICAAMALGVDMVEVDVRLSRDRVPVIFHSAVLTPITPCIRRVDDLTVTDLKALDVGLWRGEEFRGEQILTLAEVLDLVQKRIPVNLDIKVPAAIAPVVAAVQARQMFDEVVLSGCTWTQARTVRRLEPSLHVLMNVDGCLRTLFRLFSSRLAFLVSWLQARHARAAGLNIGHQLAADRFIRAAAVRNLPIWTWTVDDPRRARQLAELGATSITSNCPDRILAAL